VRYRFVLKPTWIAMNLGVIVVAIVFCWLGWWQWGRAHRYHTVSPATIARFNTPQPAARYLGNGAFVPTGDIGQRLVATGTYDTARQLTVPGQELGGRTGCYVILPLRTGGTTAVIVNRGWVPEQAGGCAAPTPPSGTVTVTGWVNQTEAPDDTASLNGEQAGQVSEIDAGQLVNLWPYELANGYVTLTTEKAGSVAVPASTTTGLRRVPSPAHAMKTFSWDFQNLGYTGQWFLFAGAGLWWWRQVLQREAYKREHPEEFLDDEYEEYEEYEDVDEYDHEDATGESGDATESEQPSGDDVISRA
jgi:cytochrome oxidase assembly protein ShyY1